MFDMLNVISDIAKNIMSIITVNESPDNNHPLDSIVTTKARTDTFAHPYDRFAFTTSPISDFAAGIDSIYNFTSNDTNYSIILVTPADTESKEYRSFVYSVDNAYTIIADRRIFTTYSKATVRGMYFLLLRIWNGSGCDYYFTNCWEITSIIRSAYTYGFVKLMFSTKSSISDIINEDNHQTTKYDEAIEKFLDTTFDFDKLSATAFTNILSTIVNGRSDNDSLYWNNIIKQVEEIEVIRKSEDESSESEEDVSTEETPHKRFEIEDDNATEVVGYVDSNGNVEQKADKSTLCDGPEEKPTGFVDLSVNDSETESTRHDIEE